MKPYVAVVGGVNVDIIGTSTDKMRHADSNLGHVQVKPGGVGRNIAENIAHLGYPVEMVTVLGDDANADLIRMSCARLGIGLSSSDMIPGCATGTYLCLNDSDGDLYSAINDMDIYQAMTPEYVAKRMDLLNGAAMVVVDANLPEETILYLSEHVHAPVAADPVSVAKASRMLRSLGGFTLIKPNRPEASLLSGVEIDGLNGLEEAGKVLIGRGIRNVFISLGSEGVYYTNGQESGIQPCFPGKIIDTTGCGDAFLAAAAVGFAEGMRIADIARLGQAASSVCAEANAAVNPLITRNALKERMER